MYILDDEKMEKLEKIQQELNPGKLSFKYTINMCDCTGCLGTCDGDCQETTEGDPNVTCVYHFN